MKASTGKGLMKKIGIITFHRSLNYGSVLQAFALQTKIKELQPKRDIEIIDFYPPNMKNIRGIFVPVKSLRNFVRNIFACFYYPQFKKRTKAFNDFVGRNLRVGNKKYDQQSDMSDLDAEFGILVAGSDQIWNNTAPDFSIKYFFPDVQKAKKVAYAPSLSNGKFELPRDIAIYDALKKFSALSVRENFGAKNMKEFLDGADIPVVLDPTLLLCQEQYDCIASKKLIKKDYIFMYSITMHKDFIAAVCAISKRTGLPVITVFSGKGSFRGVGNGIKISKNSSPNDFLSLVRDAKLVLTDSFHGTAFSVIYRKNFYSFCEEDEKNQDVRIATLLGNINLKNRILFYNHYDKENYLEKIDYSIVQPLLDNFKSSSIDYLRENIRD